MQWHHMHNSFQKSVWQVILAGFLVPDTWQRTISNKKILIWIIQSGSSKWLECKLNVSHSMFHKWLYVSNKYIKHIIREAKYMLRTSTSIPFGLCSSLVCNKTVKSLTDLGFNQPPTQCSGVSLTTVKSARSLQHVYKGPDATTTTQLHPVPR
jgi:hypothetical protein